MNEHIIDEDHNTNKCPTCLDEKTRRVVKNRWEMRRLGKRSNGHKRRKNKVLHVLAGRTKKNDG